MNYDYLLHHAFNSSCKKYLKKIAVVDQTTSLTYDILSRKAGFLASKLTNAGIKRGDRVAFYFDHTTDQAVSILAISAVSAAFVPINSLLYPEQVRHILSDSGTKILITNAPRKDKLGSIITNGKNLMQTLIIEECIGEDDLPTKSENIENDLAAILYTSGSSGKPKGVMVSHKNLLSGARIVSDYLGLSDTDRILGVLPLSFDYGLNQLITMLSIGGSYFFCQFKFPNDIVKQLALHSITGFAGIPPLWALLARSSLANTPLPHLRYITNSGGSVPTTVLNKICESLPKTKVFLMYGLTEAFRSTYLPPEELSQRHTSIGKAIPNTEIFVVSESGSLCKPHEVGELVHRGPTVSLGYWNRKEDNELRFRPFPWNDISNSVMTTEKVVFSGDLVKYDEEGFLYFIGRKDGMIKCSGFRISSSEIEEVVFKMSIAKEVAAIGVPDSKEGQVVKVFIVPDYEIIDATREDIISKIMDFCGDQMPKYMVPRYIEFVQSMPKTATGKIDYPALRAKESGNV
jgi:acyl-CoA ligase (AMP-forming) (exosortase A-associated)